MGSQMASFSQQSISSTVKTEFTLFKAGDTRTQIELYHKNPENSGSMSISIVPVSGTDEAQIEEWLNTHFTFTK